MQLMNIQSAVLALLCCSLHSHGSKVIVMAPMGSRSHWQFYGETAKVLADRGHQVTALTGRPTLNHPNITEVNLDFEIGQHSPNMFENRGFHTGVTTTTTIPGMCAEALSRDLVKTINVEDYDVILISAFKNECFFGLVANTTVPVILLCPNTMISHLHDVVGNIDFPSMVPLMVLSMVHPLTFTERLITTVGNVLIVFYVNWFYMPSIQEACREAGVCRPGMESLQDVIRRPSLMFINNVRSLETPARPYVPGVIHAGGLNCRPAKPLPKDLAEWIEGSGDAGTIYFSLGSVVKPKDMPEKYRQAFVRAFARLPQRVVWKWHEDTMEDLPTNVKLATWLPQQDILGHPKVRLFMSHGGLFSTSEATYHAVPVLGLPVFSDQGTNIHKAVTNGMAEAIEWDDLTEELLLSTILKMLTHNRYQETVDRLSLAMRDQPMSPQDLVTYWTEYVIRHKGAPHLQSPAKTMPWYVLYNVDVWLTMAATVVAFVALVVKITKVVVRKCCYGAAKTTSSKDIKIKMN